MSRWREEGSSNEEVSGRQRELVIRVGGVEGHEGSRVERRLYFSQNCVKLMEMKWMWSDDLME